MAGETGSSGLKCLILPREILPRCIDVAAVSAAMMRPRRNLEQEWIAMTLVSSTDHEGVAGCGSKS